LENFAEKGVEAGRLGWEVSGGIVEEEAYLRLEGS